MHVLHRTSGHAHVTKRAMCRPEFAPEKRSRVPYRHSLDSRNSHNTQIGNQFPNAPDLDSLLHWKSLIDMSNRTAELKPVPGSETMESRAKTITKGSTSAFIPVESSHAIKAADAKGPLHTSAFPSSPSADLASSEVDIASSEVRIPHEN